MVGQIILVIKIEPFSTKMVSFANNSNQNNNYEVYDTLI